MMELFKWQKEALVALEQHNYNGICECGTGVGKTVLGIEVIKRLPRNVLICVPTIHLQQQWKDELIKHEAAKLEDIGFVGGGEHDLTKRITIAVVNSLRSITLKKDLLVIDETHRALSEENIKFITNGIFEHIVGLTATLHREDDREDLLLRIVHVVYEYKQGDAIDDGILCPYDIINYQVYLTEEEQQDFDSANSDVRTYGPEFDYNTANAASAVRYGSKSAKKYLQAIGKRKDIVSKAKNKIQATLDIVALNIDPITNELPKTIIFNERIEMANDIAALFKEKGVDVAIYHSAMKNEGESTIKYKRRMIEEWRNGKFRIICSVKALDEGIDCPSATIAIAVSGTSVKRQFVQRLGRVLRKQEDKKAKLYQLYIPGTVDEKWVHKRSKGHSADSVTVMRNANL
jgi:RNA polymerase primary sigma factor